MITVCSVVCNDKRTQLFDLMVRSVIKYTDQDVKFVICDNGGNDLSKYRDMPNFVIVQGISSKHSGSLQHGESLNKILSLVDTPKTAIIESDCVVLRKGWDDLDFSSYKAIAAKKGEQAGQPFYHVCFMVFGTELFRHGKGIDFRPGKDGARSNRSYKPWEDVGWQIRTVVKENQIKLLKFVDCKSGNGQVFGKEFQSDELWLDGRPVVGHFGRGSNITGKAIRKGFEHPEVQLKAWRDIIGKIIE